MADRFPIDMDLCETSLGEAATRLGTEMRELSICACWSDRHNARRLQGQFGFKLSLAPACLLPSPYAWAATWGGETVWSGGGS